MPRGVLTGVNGLFFVAVVTVVALAPIPIGSNRPFFWEVNAAIIGSLAFVYFSVAIRRPDTLRCPIGAFYWPGLLLGVSMLWMIIQILPLPFELVRPFVWSEAGDALGVRIGRRISLDPAATVQMLLNYFSYAFLFFLVAQISTNESRSQRLMQALFWIVVVHAAIGIFLLFQGGDTLLFLQKWTYLGVATGFFVNRNSFATFLAFGLAIGSTLLIHAVVPRQRGRQNRPLREIFRLDTALIALAGYGSGIAVIGTALLLTASRMGAFVGAIGLLLPIVIEAVRVPGRRATIFGMVAGVALLSVLLILFSGGELAERFGSQEALQDLRWPLFQQTLGMIADRPIAGFGGGAFQDAFQIYHRLPLSADVVWDRAHNTYLELLADLGIFALAPLAAIGFVLWKIVRILRSATRAVAPVSAVTIAVIAGLHSLVDFSLQIQAIVFLFVAVLAAGYAQAVAETDESTARRHREAENPQVPPIRRSRSEPGAFGPGSPLAAAGFPVRREGFDEA